MKTVLRTLLYVVIFLVLYAIAILLLAPISLGFVHDHQPPSTTVRVIIYFAALMIAIQAMRRVLRWLSPNSAPRKDETPE